MCRSAFERDTILNAFSAAFVWENQSTYRAPSLQLNQGCAGAPGAGHAAWAEHGAGSSHATFREFTDILKNGLV